MNKQELEQIEIELLLNALRLSSGYDFGNYAKASLKRRIKRILTKLKPSAKNISDLIPHILHDPIFVKDFVMNMSVTVTEMFRDPFFYVAFKEKVIPKLKTYPFIKIWHAGCATGEEVYSMAIMLHEAGLLERTQIYGTDINKAALKIASEGIYSVDHIKKYTPNYVEFSQEASLSDYYHAKYNRAKMKDFLKQKVTFSQHNLVTDHHFGEMNVVICRNVMIYFDMALQNRVLKLFKDSLIRRGYLCLGDKESLVNTNQQDAFETVARRERIFRLLPGVNHAI